MNAPVFAIAISGSDIYLGGQFTTANNGLTPRNYAAAVDTSGTLTAWNPNLSNSVYALAINGSTVYIGGGFSSIGGSSLFSYFGPVDLTLGNPITSQALTIP